MSPTKVISSDDVASFCWQAGKNGQPTAQASAHVTNGVPVLTLYNIHPAVRIRVPLASLDVIDSMITTEMVVAAMMVIRGNGHHTTLDATRMALIAAFRARPSEGV